MNTIGSIGIALTGAVIISAVLSVLFPNMGGKKLYSALVGVYLIISFLSAFLNFDFSFDFELAEESYLDYQEYGKELTLSYFRENIKNIIYEKSGIEKDNIFIELSEEDKRVTIEKITVKTEDAKKLHELSSVLGTEIEVVN